MAKWTDMHAHLYDCSDDEFNFWINEALAAGVDKIVNSANSFDTSFVVIDQCKRFPNMLIPAIGVSPFDSANTTQEQIAALKKLLAENKQIRAIGEIGLDCTNPSYPPLDKQKPVFINQLELAIEADVPVVVHSRGMEKKTAEICRDVGVKRALFHCFTGDDEALDYISDCGYYISISGIVTYKNTHLVDLVPRIPRDLLFIETDAPYLSPVPLRGQKNKSSHIIHTAKKVSSLLEIDETELSNILEDNFQRFIYNNNHS